MDLRRTGIILCSYVFVSVCLAYDISLEVSTEHPCSIGDDVTFRCRIDDFPPGGAVLWWKRQGDEEVVIGENKQLEIDKDRYELLVNQADTAVLFYLNIRGVQLEDNGEFGCSLADDDESKLYRNLIVSNSVQAVHLYRISSANCTDVIHEYEDGESFLFTDEESFYFQCVATGSNPQPEMEFTIGYQDNQQILTDSFLRSERLISDPESGDKAFRVTAYEAVLTSSEAITVDWKANSQEFKCSASVFIMDVPMSVHIKPVMKLAPIIECVETIKVPLWTPDVTLSCKVYADPPLQAIRWYWGNVYRGTSLKPGDSLGAYRFDLLNGDKPDMKIARLTISRVFIQMYLKYHLAAKNEKGLSVHILELAMSKKRH